MTAQPAHLRNGPPSGRTLPQAPTPADIEALRAHPRFEEARTVLIKGITEHFRGNRALNRLLNDRGRALVGLFILDLHYNGAVEGGLTATRLKQRCAETGVCSPGRVTALLGAMRLLGFIREVPSEDRRIRRLAPTDLLLDTHRVRWTCFFEGVALLTPEGKLGLDRMDDEAFAAARLGALAHMYAGGMRITDYVPEFLSVARRDAGLLMVCTLGRAAREQGADALGQLDVTVSGLASHFTVSRGHVLSVLRDCEAEGLVVRRGPRGASITATERLLDVVDRFAAVGMLVHIAAVRAALAQGSS